MRSGHSYSSCIREAGPPKGSLKASLRQGPELKGQILCVSQIRLHHPVVESSKQRMNHFSEVIVQLDYSVRHGHQDNGEQHRTFH